MISTISIFSLFSIRKIQSFSLYMTTSYINKRYKLLCDLYLFIVFINLSNLSSISTLLKLSSRLKNNYE